MSNQKKLTHLVLIGLGSLAASPLVGGSTPSNPSDTMADSGQETMTPEQQAFCNRLSPRARHAFKAMSNEEREMCMKAATQECKSKNMCKGYGGCATEEHSCMGKNGCKSKGGCKTKDPSKTVMMMKKMAEKRAEAMD